MEELRQRSMAAATIVLKDIFDFVEKVIVDWNVVS